MALLMGKDSEPITEEERADLDGIAALKVSAACELKEEGNKYVKMGKKHYAKAMDCYTRAINQKALSDADSSILFANRAHVNLLLGNYRRALTDAEEAIRLCPTNVKAIYRAARAAFHLDLRSEAASFCKSGLELSPSNEDIKKLAEKNDLKGKEHEKRLAEISGAVSAAEALISAIEGRGLNIGRAMYRELTGVKKPRLDDNNMLHWPVLLLYAEAMSSDFIEDFFEADMFSSHLDMMYSESCQPLPWDSKLTYTREAIELYYQAGCGAILSRKEILEYLVEGTAAASSEIINNEKRDTGNGSKSGISIKDSGRWVKVNEKKRLCEVLQMQNYVIPGIPVFYVVSNRSDFYKLFKSGKWTPP